MTTLLCSKTGQIIFFSPLLLVLLLVFQVPAPQNLPLWFWPLHITALLVLQGWLTVWIKLLEDFLNGGAYDADPAVA